MNKLMTILSAAAMMLAASWSLDAQTVTKSRDLSPFDHVEVWKYFSVTFENSNTYRADWEINEDLAPFVDIYVRQNTLIIDLNKEGAKYMKKTYRGNDNVPTMNITIALPHLLSLTMNENSTISADSEPMYSDSFNMTVKDKVKISNFKISVEKGQANIKLTKDADVTMQMYAKSVNVATDNSAVMALSCDAQNLKVDLGGSSSVGLAGNIDTLGVASRNYAHLTAQGKGKVLNCDGKGVSLVEVERFEVEKATVVLNSAVAWVNAINGIDLDLSNSAELVFCGNPLMKIKGIKKSSVTRIENATKRETK